MAKVIELPFSISGDGGVSYTIDEAKIWQDRVLSVVMTRFNERVMRPAYGSSVSEATFDNTEDALNKIEDAVEEAFAVYLPGLTLTSVKGYEDLADGDGVITAVITFSYPKLASQSETSIILKTQYLSRSGEVLLEVGNGR